MIPLIGEILTTVQSLLFLDGGNEALPIAWSPYMPVFANTMGVRGFSTMRDRWLWEAFRERVVRQRSYYMIDLCTMDD